MEHTWFVSALWMGLALLSALISMRLAISVALVEIVIGAIGGNWLGLAPTPWTDYLAGVGAILLTFLAGAEVDPEVIRRNFWSSVGIGIAKKFDAELHTVSIEELPQYAATVGEIIEEKQSANGLYREFIGQAKALAHQTGMEFQSHVIVGHEVKTIIEFIKKQGIDLLVIGFMGHSAVYDRVMGSTCSSLVRLAPCSVLVVK